MMTLLITGTILTSVVAALWACRHVHIHRHLHERFVLADNCPGPPPEAPKLSVVVAAKDEEENIETCLRTMLDQDYPNFELIVCNDRSTDATGEIVRRIAEQDDRVRLIDIDSLPEGWCGKNHAMSKGVAASTGQWICMIDADCQQVSRRTLSTAVQHAINEKIDLLSVLPTLCMDSFWEIAVQPACSGTMMIWFNPDDVNNPDKPQAYANGAFMLIRRSAYQSIGTHEAIKDRISEDMHLAGLVKGAGLKLRVELSRDLYKVRMYSNLPDMVCGWCRIFFGTFGGPVRLFVSFLLLLMMSLLPWAAGVGGLLLLGAGGSWAVACALAGAVAIIMQLSAMFRFYRLLKVSGMMAWTYVIGSIITLYILLLAITKHLPNAQIAWKNTTYSKP